MAIEHQLAWRHDFELAPVQPFGLRDCPRVEATVSGVCVPLDRWLDSLQRRSGGALQAILCGAPIPREEFVETAVWPAIIRRDVMMPSVWDAIEVCYPFHPLCGRMSLVVADQLHDGSHHLTLRSQDGSSFLVPTWTTEAEASSVKIVDTPCLSLARHLEVRVFVDPVLASHAGRAIPDEGGVDGDSSDILRHGIPKPSQQRHMTTADQCDTGSH
jgi:hypothetical protein